MRLTIQSLICGWLEFSMLLHFLLFRKHWKPTSIHPSSSSSSSSSEGAKSERRMRRLPDCGHVFLRSTVKRSSRRIQPLWTISPNDNSGRRSGLRRSPGNSAEDKCRATEENEERDTRRRTSTGTRLDVDSLTNELVIYSCRQHTTIRTSCLVGIFFC